MENKTWAKIIAFLAVVLAVASLYVLYRRENDTVVEVYYAGQVQHVIDLTRVKESYIIEVDTEGGHNTILVEPGRICEAEADKKVIEFVAGCDGYLTHEIENGDYFTAGSVIGHIKSKR